MADNNPNQTSIYKHNKETVQRPDVGVEAQFSNKKPPKTYRYDSSLAPELSWDENPDRELAEWLLKIIADAVARGDGQQFNSPETWKGTGETFRSVAQCVSRLQSLTRPFLNWTGKAERQQVQVDGTKRVRPWWFEQDNGWYVQCRYGSRILNINGRNNAVFVNRIDEVAAVLEVFRAAAETGELDKAVLMAMKAGKQNS